MDVHINFDPLNIPVINMDSHVFMTALVASDGMDFYLLDISYAFQSNIIHNSTKRHYLYSQILYMKWFKFRFPNNSFSKTYDSCTKLITQTICGIQDMEDAMHK